MRLKNRQQFKFILDELNRVTEPRSPGSANSLMARYRTLLAISVVGKIVFAEAFKQFHSLEKIAFDNHPDVTHGHGQLGTMASADNAISTILSSPIQDPASQHNIGEAHQNGITHVAQLQSNDDDTSATSTPVEFHKGGSDDHDVSEVLRVARAALTDHDHLFSNLGKTAQFFEKNEPSANHQEHNQILWQNLDGQDYHLTARQLLAAITPHSESLNNHHYAEDVDNDGSQDTVPVHYHQQATQWYSSADDNDLHWHLQNMNVGTSLDTRNPSALFATDIDNDGTKDSGEAHWSQQHDDGSDSFSWSIHSITSFFAEPEDMLMVAEAHNTQSVDAEIVAVGTQAIDSWDIPHK